MKNKKLEIFLSIVLMVLMVLWTVGTIFAFESKIKAKADSVITYYRFEGSNVFVPAVRNNVNPNGSNNDCSSWTFTSQTYGIDNFKFTFDRGFSSYEWNMRFVSGTGSTVFDRYIWFSSTNVFDHVFNWNTYSDTYHLTSPATGSNRYYYFNTAQFSTYGFNSAVYDFSSEYGISLPSSVNENITAPNDPTGINWYIFANSTQSGGYYMATYFGWKYSRYFNGQVKEIVFTAFPLVVGDNVLLCNVIEYIDILGHYSTFYYPQAFGVFNGSQYNLTYWQNFINDWTDNGLNSTNSPAYFNFFTTRSYYSEYYKNYLIEQGENQSAESFSSGYQQGKQDGITQGLNENQPNVYKEGYDAGVIVGDSAGYTRGYTAGANDAGNYTFLGLLGAVVDAPITALTGLLSFDLLGFNMLTFFYALMTLCLIIFVIRLLLGGK